MTAADGAGLTLIIHGLQGLGGTDTLNLMLVRDVSDGGPPRVLAPAPLTITPVVVASP